MSKPIDAGYLQVMPGISVNKVTQPGQRFAFFDHAVMGQVRGMGIFQRNTERFFYTAFKADFAQGADGRAVGLKEFIGDVDAGAAPLEDKLAPDKLFVPGSPPAIGAMAELVW